MLLMPAKQPPAGDQWVHEIKYDGYRMLCHVADRVPAFDRYSTAVQHQPYSELTSCEYLINCE
jgi:hypothetical protein